MSWLLAALGFIALIILHELGHFTAAKLVGMRVERFSLFFPPLLARKRIGETEYAIGAVPLGGYVRISGMNPSEDLPDEVRTRAYHAQPVWKRVVVILAGPAVNFVLGLLLLVLFFWQVGALTPAPTVDQIQRGYPAAGVLQSGDRIVAVDGRGGSVNQFVDRIATHRCAHAPPVNRCPAQRPVTVAIDRHGQQRTLRLTPIYDPRSKRMRLGFSYGDRHDPVGFGKAVRTAGHQFVYVIGQTAALPAKLFDAKQRRQLHGTVGLYETTRQALIHDPGDVVGILALISLALAVVNLFPFLPLDGGHIFWALVELLRRRPVSYSTMERSGVVGFAIVLMLFVIGLSNDVHQLTNGGFGVR